MIKSRVWSEQKKKEAKDLMQDKNIMFITVNDKGSGTLSSDLNYDLIFGYNKNHDIYYACKANIHSEYDSISFNKSKFIRSNENTTEISVAYKQMGAKRTYERVVKIPGNMFKTFCENADYYLDDYQQNPLYQERLEE